jgi:hypothetical protein
MLAIGGINELKVQKEWVSANSYTELPEKSFLTFS